MNILAANGNLLISNNWKLEICNPTIPKTSLKNSSAAFDKATKTIKFNKKKLKNI